MKKRTIAVILSFLIAFSGLSPQAYASEASPGQEAATSEEGSDSVSSDSTSDTGSDTQDDEEKTDEGNGDVTSSDDDGDTTGDDLDESVSANRQGGTVSADSAEDEGAEDELFPGEAEWLKKHGLTKTPDGQYKYVDEFGKVWYFDPEDPELFKYFSDDKEIEEYAPVRNRMNGYYDGEGVRYTDPYLFPLDARYYRYPPYHQNSDPLKLPVIRHGVDVSKFQGVISESNWRKMKNEYGLDFAFIRAGFRGYGDSGSLNKDNCFDQNIKNAYNAGVKVGVYYFSQAISESEAKAEADHCMQICSSYKNKITLPMVIDYEYNGDPGRLRKADLSRSEHTRIVKAFCSRVKSSGYVPMIYANKSMLLDDMYVDDIPSEDLIWMANFSNKNAPAENSTSYSKRLSCWQFTSQFTGYGPLGKNLISSTYVDMDFWYGYFPGEAYTVTFNSNGGSSVASQQVKVGGKVTKPKDPTRTGHIFLGWYKDSKLTTPWNFDSDTIKGKTTIYAKWEAMPLVTFNTTGGSKIASQYVPKGGKATRPVTVPTRSGYVFEDWYKDSACTEKWDFENTVITANVTIYAKWLKLCNVTFNTDGGSAVTKQVVTEGQLAVVPEVPVKEGHTFRGWYTKPTSAEVIPDEADKWDFDTDIVRDHMTLYAWMQINEYDVHFDPGAGSAVQKQEVKWNRLAVKPDDPVWDDHDFRGWYKDPGYSKPWRFNEYRIKEETTLYARWTEFEGWKKTGNVWLYYIDADVQTGWLTVGGSTYYLAKAEDVAAGKAGTAGERLTGAQTISNVKTDENGDAVMEGGAPVYTTESYYFNRKGVMQTGWIADGSAAGKRYYDPMQGGALAHDTWITDGKKRYYLDQNGNKKTGDEGLLSVDGYSYAVDNNGAVKTGWVKVSDKWYYFGIDDEAHYGAMTGAGEIVVGGKHYLIDADGSRHSGWSSDDKRYYDTNGVLITGWKKINGDWYYFYPDSREEVPGVTTGHALGDKATGLVAIDGKLYSFDALTGIRSGSGESVAVDPGTGSTGTTGRGGVVKTDRDGFVKTSDGSEIYLSGSGKIVTDAWVTVDDKQIRIGSDGMRKTGTAKIDGVLYRFGDSGEVAEILKTGWVTEGGRSVYYDDNGILQQDKVLKIGNKLYAFGDTGEVLTGGKYAEDMTEASSVADAAYLIDDEGKLVTGWYSYGGVQYYFSEENGAKLTGVHKIGAGRYYFDAVNGSMKTDAGWTDANKRYYVTDKGTLQTGWKDIPDQDHRYYFGKDGVRGNGVIKVGTKLYYQTSDGIVKGDGNIYTASSGDRYLINDKGVLKTGWQTVGGVKYYFDRTTGKALSGYQQIGGKWYDLP